MTIRLRMALHGTRHKKVFHIVAIHNALRRDAKPKELLGIYDPHTLDLNGVRLVRWSVDRIHHWLHAGAQPSASVVKLLERVRPLTFLGPVCRSADTAQGGILAPNSPYHSRATTPKHPVVKADAKPPSVNANNKAKSTITPPPSSEKS